MSKKKIFFILSVILLPPFLAIALLISGDRVITASVKGKLYSHIEKIPAQKAGLLLGTSKYLRGGYLNPFFIHRMEAAVSLYRAKKIRYIIASGDNRRHNYNEPRIMKEYLIKQGVPSSAIYLDYAGFRTLDSVVRCSKIFGQKSFVVISQKFHNERAIFIANHYGLDVAGFNARDVAPAASMGTRIREVFARGKAFLDLYITGKQPYFLGEEIKLPR